MAWWRGLKACVHNMNAALSKVVYEKYADSLQVKAWTSRITNNSFVMHMI
jgi:hypothetical protein